MGKAKKIKHNPGSWNNPKRLQGRDKALWASGDFPASEFQEAPGAHERARGGQQRLYHRCSFTASGQLYDDWLKTLSDRAMPFELAGIELGVNGARSFSRSAVRFDEI